ncbi:hypothetical protein LUW77_22365 [Streptomyces radiopugnans]|nr:hypothetical protein LUW77_22365 [Streptomyces radiopugnans]
MGQTGRTFTGRGTPPYGEEHEKVFRALAAEEGRHPGEPVHLQDVSRAADLPEERTRVLLHDLVAVHKLATEVQEDAKPRHRSPLRDQAPPLTGAGRARTRAPVPAAGGGRTGAGA